MTADASKEFLKSVFVPDWNSLVVPYLAIKEDLFVCFVLFVLFVRPCMVSLAVLLVPLEYPWWVTVHQGVLMWYKSFWVLNSFVIENSIKWKLSSTFREVEARSWKALNKWDFLEGDFVIFRPMGGKIFNFESFLSYFFFGITIGLYCQSCVHVWRNYIIMFTLAPMEQVTVVEN